LSLRSGIPEANWREGRAGSVAEKWNTEYAFQIPLKDLFDTRR
jgi:hypothetical protein